MALLTTIAIYSALAGGTISGVSALTIGTKKTKKWIKRVFSGGGGQANWQKWWESLPSVDSATYNAIIADIENAWNIGAGGTDYISTESATQIVKHVYTMQHDGSYTKDKVLNYVKKTLPEGVKFTRAVENFVVEFNNAFSAGGYDKDYWTSERLADVFQYKYNLEGAPENASSVVGFVTTKVLNDFDVKKEMGAIDDKGVRQEGFDFNAETGVATETEVAPGEEPGKYSKWEQQVADMFEENNFEVEANRPLFDKLSGALKAGDMELYDAQQLMQSDPAFVEQEAERMFDELLPTLDELDLQELNNIAQFETESADFITKAFARVAPEIGMMARQMGGIAARGDTFVTDTLAKYRAQMEETRAVNLASLRLATRQGQVQRRGLLEVGQFERVTEAVSDAAKVGLESYQKLLETQIKTTESLKELSLQKSQMLAQRAQDRYTRTAMQEMRRAETQRAEAISRANKKARKLGTILYPTLGAISGFLAGGGPVGAVVGAGVGYAQSRMGAQAPSLASIYTQYGQIGKQAGQWWEEY